MGVGSPKRPVNTSIHASRADKLDMGSPHVGRETEIIEFGMKPRYLRYNLWTPEADPRVTAADWTISANTLPRPSSDEWQNASALRMVAQRPDLFQIISPIDVSALERLTVTHPNRPFVESVIEGIKDGFWPWASTTKEGYPLTHDESKLVHLTEEKEKFISEQVKHEQDLGRMSLPFGKDLLPGMYCMPNYVVPKPHSAGWRLVNDLSAGLFSLNSMVEHEFITGYPLDNLTHFGELLMKKQRENPGVRFVAWKSDVAEAYRICPMHVLWQLKQIVKLKGELMVDRVNVFGGSGSGPIFISVNSLVAWVTKYVKAIDDLIYVDDSFGVDEEGNLVLYLPYGERYPSQQVRLLELWDELRIPLNKGSKFTVVSW
jgi:hypothetical protein